MCIRDRARPVARPSRSGPGRSCARGKATTSRSASLGGSAPRAPPALGPHQRAPVGPLAERGRRPRARGGGSGITARRSSGPRATGSLCSRKGPSRT
eukprot:6320433-Pyramimonas_sp.AAC.1